MPRTLALKKRIPQRLAGRHVGVIGLGQIGGSIAQCLSQYRPDVALYGTDRNKTLRVGFRKYGTWCESVGEMVSLCDLLILSMPIGAIVDTLPQIAEAVQGRSQKTRLVVTDTGTIKLPVVKAARRHARVFDFIGMHPLAGVEQSGWGAARPNMFHGRKIVYCGREPAPAAAMVRGLIRLLGGAAFYFTADEHDRLVAEAISLPHIVAFAAQAASREEENILRSGSWQALVRVAASDPEMVAAFLAGNYSDIKPVLKRYTAALDRLVSILEQGDEATRKHLRRIQGE